MKQLKKITVLLLIIGLFSPATILLAQTMTSGNYTIQSDSVNFAGNRSTSGSYSVEDTAGEIATGESQSSGYRMRAGYQQGSSTPIVPSTTTPPTTSTPTTNFGGGSGFVEQLTNVMNFRATPQGTNINLSWNNPSGMIFDSVRLVRSDLFFPRDINEGDVIYEGPAENYQDFNVIIGTTYYYAIFAKDIHGNYSSGALAQARIAPSGEIILVPTSTDPFINIPIVPNVPSGLANLSVIDFDFFQSSIKLVNDGTGIVIDGTKNLTISLDYNKVPEILKTIAFTLIDPEDSSRVFPFLLRVNKEKTAFEATLAPLGKSGTYQMKVIVLDYKNQGLKRLEGSLKAFVFEQAQSLANNPKTFARNLISVIILILLIVVAAIAIYRRRKNEAQ